MDAALEAHAANAVAKWESFGPEHVRRPDAPPGIEILRLPQRGSTRIVATREQPPAPGGALPPFLTGLGRLDLARVVLEDPFDTLKLDVGDDVTVHRFPVMRRDAAPIAAVEVPGCEVVQARDTATLAMAERVIVDGFPYARARGLPGGLLPPPVLDHPGWRVWLAYDRGTPAAAGITFDDGALLGVYFMATLPAHRSRGLARAVLTAALAADPDRPSTLVATKAGQPLYASLGFTEISTATWYLWGSRWDAGTSLLLGERVPEERLRAFLRHHFTGAAGTLNLRHIDRSPLDDQPPAEGEANVWCTYWEVSGDFKMCVDLSFYPPKAVRAEWNETLVARLFATEFGCNVSFNAGRERPNPDGTVLLDEMFTPEGTHLWVSVEEDTPEDDYYWIAATRP